MPKIKPVNQSVVRATILKAIRANLAAIEQWSEMEDYGRSYYYSSKAEALIELLEVDDCGSIGGFDDVRGQPEGYQSLKSRYKWLRELKS
jgi:hypothetical protein